MYKHITGRLARLQHSQTRSMKAYYYAGEGDQRLPHRGEQVNDTALQQIGVLTWQLPQSRFTEEQQLAEVNKIAAQRQYKNRDVITVSKEAMGDVYEMKVKSFFEEHLHEDEEIRFILDGEGYFDVRTKEDRWIRLAMEKGDLAVLPAGIFHRFTTAETDYIKAMRLFKEDPVWTPLNRTKELEETNAYRKAYMDTIAS
ncbi:ARD/ARD' family-domain-containing protein [Protomyces lactucae-debilis]|uniref:Acireductone dioxygenase n=1 Tax=Protomyces lactucae-debilis TaxID=2754530 RepID=A0A1Y2EYH2_PROLT|nr:ARD/ARD' family-domain-containing protein [Protomyces lactucae-debilis]ORY76643.1 ARD/ARD' family-domain-containing protein [Protomyces lactucae-debilis]